MTKKRKHLKFTTTGRTIHADIDRHWELDEESLQSESICASNDCEELGLHYIPYPYSDSGEVLVCHSHLQDMSDYADSR